MSKVMGDSQAGETSAPMIPIDKNSIRNNLHARVSYLVGFIGFNALDADALQTVAPLIRPHIPPIVEAMYDKLWSYDITREALMKPSNPYLPRDQLQNQERDRVRYMHNFMGHWVLKLFIADWEDPQTFAYFDRVGISHIGESAFRHRGERGAYKVDYIHIALLFGVLQNELTTKILEMEKLTMEQKTRAVSALTKAMWIQNDLMSRHYIPPVESIIPPGSRNQPAPHLRKPADPNAEDEPKCPFGYTSETNEMEYPEEPWPDESDEEDDLLHSGSDEDGLEQIAYQGGSTTAAEDSPITPNGGKSSIIIGMAMLEENMRNVEVGEGEEDPTVRRSASR